MMVTLIVGDIGSGKSTVLSALRELGKVVVDCDEINREMWTDPDYLDELKEVFPEVVIEGNPDKKALSRLIFNNEEARTKLNSIAHPRIEKMLLKRIENIDGDVFIEVPLFNALKRRFYDEVWVVRCPLEMQIENLSLRDNISKEEAYKKIRVQRQNYETDIPKKEIVNDKEKAAVKRQVLKLLAERNFS